MSNLPEVRQDNFIANYQELYKLAKTFSMSGLVPTQYHGKPEDCMIALNMAQRSGMEPIFVMQNMYVVKGHPSWSGQACIAMLRNCGLFRDIRPVYNTDKTSCRLEAVDAKSGQKVVGTTITLEMAAKEGWGAKWKTMPEQMLAYRAAAFFARVWCPEVLMGCMVEGEPEDVERERSATPNPFAELPTEPQQIAAPQQSEGIELELPGLEKDQVMFDEVD